MNGSARCYARPEAFEPQCNGEESSVTDQQPRDNTREDLVTALTASYLEVVVASHEESRRE